MASLPLPTSSSSSNGNGGVQMSADQIKDMMAIAQRSIEERKRALDLGPSGLQQQASIPTTMKLLPAPPKMFPQQNLPNFPIPTAPVKRERESNEPDIKKRKIAELQAQIQSKLTAGVLKISGQIAANDEGKKPVPLLLDNEGRTVDMFGKEVSFQHHTPTLKANIRAQKRQDFKIPSATEPSSKSIASGIRTSESTTSSTSSSSSNSTAPKTKKSSTTNIYFDNRVSTVKPRQKKMLKFNEPGKYIGLANRQRMQAQLQKLQSDIAEKARKTGISTAARLARLSGAVSTSSERVKEYIPQVEWWDGLLLGEKDEEGNKINNNKEILSYETKYREGAVSNLIEHPIQVKCPTEPAATVFMPVFLTKAEKKKLRRQNRREAWKDKQEKIRLGLEPAPAAKVRISNLMRVLGVEAVQDPTKIEAHVKQQMAKRLKTHLDSNASRKLTPEQQREKKIKKTREDLSLGVHVAVYRIDELSQSKKFKVEANARQLLMTGCILLYKECNVVVVEGGPKQQKKYKRLMMSRIKWGEDFVTIDNEERPNKCTLVWEGQTKERSFPDIKFKLVQNELQAREHFKKFGVGHFLDFALSGNVLESNEM